MKFRIMKNNPLTAILSFVLLFVSSWFTNFARADVPASPPDWSPGYYPRSATDPYAYTNSPFGPGVWGANRRLESGAGFGSVSGTFSHSDMFIYKDPDKDFPRNPKSGENESTFLQRRGLYHRNKPTFYYGAHHPGVIIDTGMQWEEFSMGTPANPFPRGWGIFMSIRSPGVWPTIGDYTCWNWREVPTGALENGLGDLNLEFNILQNGAVETTASGAIGTISTGQHQAYWPRTANSKLVAGIPKGQVTGVDQLRLRRVIGITQTSGPKGFYADGSYFRGVHFRGGSLRSLTAETNGNLTLGTSSVNWSQVPAGRWYAPTPSDWKNDSIEWPWAIDFRGIYKLNPASGAEPTLTQSQQAARYNEETVDINLLPKGKYKGRLLQNSKRVNQ